VVIDIPYHIHDPHEQAEEKPWLTLH